MTKKQMAMAYIIYMILGSEYKTCKFRNPLIEGRLRIAYTETKTKDQVKWEESVINKIPEIGLPEDIRSEISYYQNGANLIMEFEAEEGTLKAEVTPDGKYRISTWNGAPEALTQ